MVSRKLERLISPGKWIHNLSVLSLSMALVRALNKMTKAGMPESVRIA